MGRLMAAGGRRKTHEQPLRSIMRRGLVRYRTEWLELECGHETTALGHDFADAVRCQECNPVRIGPIARPDDAAGGGW